MRSLNFQTFMYYLIYSGARKAFCRLFNTRKFDLPCSRNIYHFKKLS